MIKILNTYFASTASREDIMENSSKHQSLPGIGNMSMERATISSWIRQSRYRAKRQDIYSDLEISDVEEIIECYKNQCAYCGSAAETLDHPFPLKIVAPNIPANILPSCKDCKNIKKNNDLVWMFSSGKLEQESYLALLQQLFDRRGGDIIKGHVRKVTGIIGES
jgi:hypothetical protein